MLDIRTKHTSVYVPYKCMPWWMMRIRDFNGLDIIPSRITGYTKNGHEIIQPCDPAKLQFWAVYGSYSPDGKYNCMEYFDDFETKGEAQKFYHHLIDLFPHLADWRPRYWYEAKSTFPL